MSDSRPDDGGDFLRCFTTAQHVEQLSGVIDEVEEAVCRSFVAKCVVRETNTSLRWWISTGTSSLCMGIERQGADFSYDGRWSYPPLVVSLGGSGECLKVVNQTGQRPFFGRGGQSS